MKNYFISISNFLSSISRRSNEIVHNRQQPKKFYDLYSLLSKESQALIETVAQKINMTNSEVAASIAIICQKGGTARQAQSMVYSIVNGKRLELSTIRAILRKKNLKFTLCQCARTNATNIYQVYQLFTIEGDLSKKIARHEPSVTLEEKIWLSNFQMDNEDCPQNVRDLLMQHYKALSPGRNIN